MKKLVQTAKFNQKHWLNELCIFLHSYQDAPHAITQKPPALLFFNRPLKMCLPDPKEYALPLDDTLRKNQINNYERIKEYSDKDYNAKQLIFNIGDNVIMKR